MHAKQIPNSFTIFHDHSEEDQNFQVYRNDDLDCLDDVFEQRNCPDGSTLNIIKTTSVSEQDPSFDCNVLLSLCQDDWNSLYQILEEFCKCMHFCLCDLETAIDEPDPQRAIDIICFMAASAKEIGAHEIHQNASDLRQYLMVTRENQDENRCYYEKGSEMKDRLEYACHKVLLFLLTVESNMLGTISVLEL